MGRRAPAGILGLTGAYALAVWPLVMGGFPNGHDAVFELARAAQFSAAFQGGQWVPAWAPDLYGGFGSPIFLFYAPGFSALTTLADAFLPGVPESAVAALLVAAAAGLYGMYRLVLALLPDDDPNAWAAARVAAAFFVLHPYLLCDALIRSANAEYLALCLAPIPLAGVFEAARRPVAGFAKIALGLALVVLSHNLTALVTASGVALAALARFVPGREWQAVVRVALAGIFGLWLAAFFWLPALTLIGRVRTDELTAGRFDFHGHFPAPAEVFGYEQFFATGWLTPAALLAGAAVLAILRNGSGRRVLAAALGAALGLLFLVFRPSTFVWEVTPFMSLFQFPWRMLGPLALLTAIVVGLALVHGLRHFAPHRRPLVELALLLLIAVNALPQLWRAKPIPPEFRETLPAELSRRGVRVSQERATVLDEYLPRGTLENLWRSPTPRMPLYRVSGATDVEFESDTGTVTRLRVAATAPARIELARWAFPDWQVTLDDEPHPSTKSPFGLVALDLPAGSHRVVVRYRAPLVRRAGLVGSGLGLATLLALLSWRPRKLFGGESSVRATSS